MVDSVRHRIGVLQGHPVSIITDYQPLTAFLKSLQTNPIRIRWQESLSQLGTVKAQVRDLPNMGIFQYPTSR